jgi:LuxR family maltose regulon positive regulatory protein
MTESITPSLTLTKLQRPRVGRRLVARPQLLERLNASESLTLILAPAGYSKTTLLSMRLETCDMPTAWLSLDEHDDDVVVFATYLVEALHTLFPAVVDDTLSAINGLTAPPPAAIARSLLNDLADVEQDFILVLDDYHFIHNQAIHDLLIEIVRHLPRPLHLVIASRRACVWRRCPCANGTRRV